jgi:hypothetical protein
MSVRKEGLPLVQSLPSWKAAIVGVDRSSGRFFKVSRWETAPDHDASEAPTAEHHVKMRTRIGANRHGSRAL